MEYLWTHPNSNRLHKLIKSVCASVYIVRAIRGKKEIIINLTDMTQSESNTTVNSNWKHEYNVLKENRWKHKYFWKYKYNCTKHFPPLDRKKKCTGLAWIRLHSTIRQFICMIYIIHGSIQKVCVDISKQNAL